MTKASRGALFLVGLLLALPPALRADDAVKAAAKPQLVDVKEGTLTYHLVHKLHEVTGTSHTLEGKARVLPDGTVQVQVRAPVKGFDSGNSNRDEHMREVTREAMFPYVSLRGTLHASFPPAGATTETLHATIEMNGEKQAIEIPVELKPEAGGARASFKFPISLDALKIERPELLFVKVDDAVVITGDLLLVPAP